jgi:hypothetical protein
MKKYFIFSLLISVLITTVFAFGSVIPNAGATTVSSGMTISQFVELMITIGAVPADRVVAARAMAVTLGSTSVLSTTTVSTSTSYIQVLSPNGGESWDIDMDVAYSVTWGATNLPGASVALVSTAKKNNVCELMTAPVATKKGNNTFNIKLKTAQCYNLLTGTSTPVTSGTYKIRVYYKDAVGTVISDESNATFRILPKLIPSIKVTYPNGGESLVRSRDYDAKYRLTNVTNVDNNLIYMHLLDNTGTSVFNSHKAKRSDGVYNLELPSSLSAGNYKVKFTATESTDDVVIEDISDNYFWVSNSL